jgi:4-diphosphocytidyl-2-C-methyl-D-erythritol kinase
VPRSFTLRASAKINLMLRVGAPRPDGFHDVHTILQSIALADRLTFTPRPGPFVLDVHAPDEPGVPTDGRNLVWRAADRLWRALGRGGDPRDVRVRLDKHVPVGAGLGGGSADAAAALVGLRVAWHGRLSDAALRTLASALGADVPFFLAGGTAVGVGRGDELVPADDVRRLGLVIIKPAVGVSTADAYRWHDEDPGRTVDHRKPAPWPTVEVGWSTGPITIANDLQRAVVTRHPIVADAIQASLGAGALAAAMTGSGSAVFAIFPRAAVAGAVRTLGRPGWTVIPTATINRAEARRGLGLG